MQAETEGGSFKAGNGNAYQQHQRLGRDREGSFPTAFKESPHLGFRLPAFRARRGQISVLTSHPHLWHVVMANIGN